MIDDNLIQSIKYLESIDKLVEASLGEYLDPKLVLQTLKVDYTDTNNLLRQQSEQATKCLFYNSIAAKLNAVNQNFNDNVLERWFAHCRKYATLYLDYMGTRATKEMLGDYVINIFSSKCTDAERSQYAILCFTQEQKNLKGKNFNLEDLQNSEDYVDRVKQFYTRMYNCGHWYEEMMELKNKFAYRKNLAESLADALKQVTICASNIVKLRLMGSGETPKVSQDLVNSVGRLENQHRVFGAQNG